MRLLTIVVTGLLAYPTLRSANAQPQRTYSITDLGSFQPWGINNASEVVGYQADRRVVLCTRSGNISYLEATVASGINDPGQVVGGLENNHAFLYDGAIHDLGTFPGGRFSTAFAINDAGVVVGYSNYSNDGGLNLVHAFVYDETMRDLGALPGCCWWNSRAQGINNAGIIVGESDSLDSPAGPHAFVYDGTMHDIGTLGGRYSTAQGINDAGTIVGWSDLTMMGDIHHAFVYDSSGMKDLGALGGSSSGAWSINNRGQVVGYSQFSATMDLHAFLHQNGNMLDLNSAIAPDAGWILVDARGINNRGQIIGIGEHNGSTRAFRLDPTSAQP